MNAVQKPARDDLVSVGTAYREKLEVFQSGSGYPVKGFYTAADLPTASYAEQLGDPGEYPYTRGIYPNMYRGRLWSRRHLCGFGSPSLTNERIRYLVEGGNNAINIAFDIPTNSGVDSDH